MKSGKEIIEFVQASLSLFKAVPNLEDEKFQEYTLDNEYNLENGFFVTEKAFKVCPCVADERIVDFIKSKFGYNIFELNRSFYKSFKKVTELTPQQILVNKLLHYFSTYGMESFGIFDRSLVYIPNDALELPKNSKPVKITVIDAIDKDEIETRANNLIKSGVALSAETLKDLMVVVKFLEIELNVDDVPNKEFAIRLCKLLNILPKDPVKFLRYMIYVATGSTLLIKDVNTIYKLRKFEKKPKAKRKEDDDFPSITITKEEAEKLKTFFNINIEVTDKAVRISKYDNYFSRYIQKNGIEKLASCFHRFKPLWLSFKIHSDYLRKTINKMRKLADKYHKPVAPKFLETLTSAESVNIDELKKELSKVTVYRKIAIVNAILYRQANPDSIFYNIRNKKAFATEFSGGLKTDFKEVLDVIIKSIANDIRPKVQGKKIYIPEHFTYAVPVSEKKFLGNIPFGSSYTFEDKSCVVGVHWFNVVEDESEWRIDLDLHLNSEDIDIGWHNDFNGKNSINTKERKIIFSGDMTDAPIENGGATEAYFVGESLTDEVLMVNLNYFNCSYINGGRPVPFKLVLANVNQEKIDRQYLIDAHEVAFCVPNEISSGEMFLGFLVSNEVGEKKFYFFPRDMGNRIVSRSTKATVLYNSAMLKAAENSLSLNEILKRAGAIFEEVDAENCDINLDPAEVTADILIDLFAK